jgi:hypothetical protein
MGVTARLGYRLGMATIPNTPESSKDPVDRAEALDEPEGKEDPGIPVSPDDPDVDPTGAGFPSSPERDDENTV